MKETRKLQEAFGMGGEEELNQEVQGKIVPERPDFLQIKEQLEAYKLWRDNVPAQLRGLVEGQMLGTKTFVDQAHSPLVGEFYQATRQLLAEPELDANSLAYDKKVLKQLKYLQRLVVEGEKNEFVNLFSLLTNAQIDFGLKTDFVEKKLLARLEWLARLDRQHQQAVEKEDLPEDIKIEDSGESDEYEPHRAQQEEQESEPGQAVAMTYSFFGGYYNASAYDSFDPQTLTWKREAMSQISLPEQGIDSEKKRIYRGKLLPDGTALLRLPDGWGVRQSSFKVGGKEAIAFFAADKNGIISLRTEEVGESTAFQVEIGPCGSPAEITPPDGTPGEVGDKFPDELRVAAMKIMEQKIPEAVKARQIVSLIRSRLEYDKDVQWEAIYKSDPSEYFNQIWQHKKAKCDEANTLATRFLQKQGFHTRFLGGHSVSSKSPQGWSLMIDSNRHAWMRVWDEENKEWLRLDATPKGDPNVDEEQQEQDLGEGDWGEQEAELMSQEELDQALKIIDKEEKEKQQRQSPELKFAEEAGCSSEEAKRVLDKIRLLREKYKNVLQQAERQWQNLVRTNLRERIVDRGPVPLSQMDEIDEDELVAGYIEILAKEDDPLIGRREEKKIKKEKYFGGYEVYLGADMSDSMGDTIAGRKKSDSQRDMVFLIIDSCMSASETARRKHNQLKAPMPVKISLTVFGISTEIVLPLTDKWGPSEQIKIYRALDSAVGGGTPDHNALFLIQKQIEQAEAEEKDILKTKSSLQRHNWSMRRFVLVVADGGSNEPSEVKEMVSALNEQGVSVDLFLIASEDDDNLRQLTEKTYGSVALTPEPQKLAEHGLAKLTERIREAYGRTQQG